MLVMSYIFHALEKKYTIIEGFTFNLILKGLRKGVWFVQPFQAYSEV